MANNNSKKFDLEALAELFRRAGANDPEQWASSQINEGINQLARFSFLKSITTEWLKEDDLAWVDNQIQYDYSTPGEPCSQLSKALQKMLDKNVSREAIVDLIRVVQYNTLYHVCSTIDRTYEPVTPVTNWSLYEQDEEGNAIDVINCLHESLLDFDPSGKEMRPREI